MAISVCDNCISFGTYFLCNHPNGVYVNGTFSSTHQNATAPFQGDVSGYASGGSDNDAPPAISETLQKFPFTSDSSASNIAELVCAGSNMAGLSSTTHGYLISGRTQKFPFAADAGSTCLGNLSPATSVSGGSGFSNPQVGGYAAGNSDPGERSRIYRTPFTSDGGATCVGTLCEGTYTAGGHSSVSAGFTSGGRSNSCPAGFNMIQRIPFASQTAQACTATLVTPQIQNINGTSSSTHGYSAGGAPGQKNDIQKFPFAGDGNATDVGELSQGRDQMGTVGQSSTTSGYAVGGNCEPTPSNNIDKYPFASDSNSTDIGNLAVRGNAIAGHQF